MSAENCITCPFHGGPIATACSLENCDLWVEHHDKRCALHAIKENRENWDKNPAGIVAELLGIDQQEAKDKIMRSYEMLRMSILQQNTSPQFVRPKYKERCIVCTRTAKIFKEGWGWCSKKCYKWKPLQAVKLEHEWGEDLGTLLHRWRKMKMRVLTDIIKLDYPTIQWLLRQHTGWTKAPTPQRWLKSSDPLVPSPALPSKKRLRRRISKSGLWVSVGEKKS